jgi:hypothetical protein
VKEGEDPAAVEAAVYEEIEKLKNDPVPAHELQKVKNRYKANAYRRLASPIGIGLQLLIDAGLGDWNHINTSTERADAVTAEDIQRAASTYLVEEKRTVGVFLRKEGAQPEDPEVAALSAEAQPMARQALKQLEEVTDPAQLQQMIAQMKEGAGQAPPEMQPALDLLLKRAGERLEALSAAAEVSK